MKPILSFYTNMPTPYQLDFFDSLKEYFDLRVVYFTERENDRQWHLNVSGNAYHTTVLKNNKLALFVQKKIPSFHFSNQIRKTLQEDPANFVIVNGTYWSPNVLMALSISSKSGKQVAFWGEPVFESKGILFQVKKLMLSAVIKNTDFLFAIGKAAEIGYRQYGYKKRIIQLPYSVEIKAFRPELLDQKRLQDVVDEYKGGNELIIISSGSLIHRKGMDTVIRAFNLLDSGLNVKLLLIGGGPAKAELQTLAADNSRIQFLDFQPKEMIPYLFHIADLFVFASRYDGWGLVINEAFAGECAIVSSNSVAAARDHIVDGENGFLLEPEDITGFATRMAELIGNPELRERFVANGKVTAKKLSSDYNAKRVYEIYRDTE